jgi:hemoglobin
MNVSISEKTYSRVLPPSAGLSPLNRRGRCAMVGAGESGMNDPYLQRFGGPQGVSRLTFRFYDLVLASDRLRPIFEGVDMPRLLEHQAAFIVSVLRGEPAQSETELAALHAHLEIGEAEFDEMVALLARAVEEEGHAPAEAERVLLHFRRMRPRLVGAIGRGSPVAG